MMQKKCFKKVPKNNHILFLLMAFWLVVNKPTNISFSQRGINRVGVHHQHSLSLIMCVWLLTGSTSPNADQLLCIICNNNKRSVLFRYCGNVCLNKSYSHYPIIFFVVFFLSLFRSFYCLPRMCEAFTIVIVTQNALSCVSRKSFRRRHHKYLHVAIDFWGFSFVMYSQSS